jgi:hypothetical protein
MLRLGSRLSSVSGTKVSVYETASELNIEYGKKRLENEFPPNENLSNFMGYL